MAHRPIVCPFLLGPLLYMHCSLLCPQHLARSQRCTHPQPFILIRTLESGYFYFHFIDVPNKAQCGLLIHPNLQNTYPFPGDAVTKYHKLHKLIKTIEINYLTVWRLDTHNQGVSRAMFPLKSLEENPSLPLLAPAFLCLG